MNILGVDIGGTTIKGGIVSDGKIIKYCKKPTNIKNGLNEFTKSLFSVIDKLIKYADSNSCIGISSTGDINPLTGTVIYATDSMPGYTGYNLKQIIETKYQRKTVVLNDSLSALLGEYAYGAAKGIKDVVMLTLGTGVGGGVLTDGKLILGNQYRASRLGHMTMYKKGRTCTCGKTGCIEAYISANGLLKTAENLGEKFDDANDIFLSKNKGFINQVIEIFTDDLMSVIDNYIAIFDPEIIIIGGGLVLTSKYWWDRLLEKNNSNITIIPAFLGNDSGIIGITYLTENKLIEGV